MNQDDNIMLSITECLRCGNIVHTAILDLMAEQEQIDNIKEKFGYDVSVTGLTLKEYNKLKKEFCNCTKC